MSLRPAIIPSDELPDDYPPAVIALGDIEALGVDREQAEAVMNRLTREVREHPDRNTRDWLIRQARAHLTQARVIPGYVHKDTQDSFAERMRDLGHGDLHRRR